ncbi:TIGR04283 family arsenosugar biosynthesis glycosyltransferase [Roseobacter sp.]|uniref:TIGR04283 family arsenosugar biosynthesis glycosyltransferase n=1 Tax=Roseobacter sp. TaxID=1907202 RepID=UPI00385A2A29
MRAPISVIIPTLNAETQLGACLAALMPGLEAGLIRELIVADGGSQDATVAIAKAWGAEVVEGAPSRGRQLRQGCAQAKGDWLLVLHADTELQPDWVGPTILHLKTNKAGWFRLAFAKGGFAGRLVAGWANLRSLFGLPYGDQGLLVPRGLYFDVGGYPDQPLMEDVALARALKGRLTQIDAVAVTCPARYHRHGWVRRGTRNLWTLMRYFAGASPTHLLQSYRR